MDAAAFGSAVRTWKQQGVLPVLCLDEFEALMEHANQFDNDFFNHLRALMDDNAVMFVIASFERLDVYQKRRSLTSRFFNLGHVHKLDRLRSGEADALVKLPAAGVTNAQSALKPFDQQTALDWGKGHPYLLQLACSVLCEATHEGKDVRWARQQFDEQASRLTDPPRQSRRWWLPLRWLFMDLPIRIGGLAKRIGLIWNDVVTWAVGIGVILLLVALLVGLISSAQARDFISRLFGQGP
jgi:hypothetical protein